MAQIRFDGITESGDRGSVFLEVDANGNLQTSAVSSTGVAQGFIGDAAEVAASPYILSIIPSDVTVYDPPLLGFRVGTTTGDVAVVSNSVTVVIPNVQIGETIPCEITQILATGTAATGITGWQAKA